MDSDKSDYGNQSQDNYMRGLRFLYHVVEAGSAKEAAKLLDVQADTISKVLKRTLTSSNALGELYIKNRGKLELTTRGETLYGLARDYITLMNQVQEATGTYEYHKNTRSYTFAITPIYNLEMITRLCKLILKGSPHAKLEVIQVSDSEDIDLIQTNNGSINTLMSNNKIDLFLGTKYNFSRKKAVHKIGTDEWKLVFSQNVWEKLFSVDFDNRSNDLPLDIDTSSLFENFQFIFTDYYHIKSHIETVFSVDVILKNKNYELTFDMLLETGALSIVPHTAAAYANANTNGQIMYTDLPSGLNIPQLDYFCYFSPSNVQTEPGNFLLGHVHNVSEEYF